MTTITADYVNEEVKGVKEVFDLGIKQNLEMYLQIPFFSMRETTEWTEIFNSTESFSGTTKLAELEEADVSKLQDGYTTSITNERYGSAFEISSTSIQKANDGTLKINEYITRQATQAMKDAINYMVETAFEIWNNAFESSADTLAPDAVELCGTHAFNGGQEFTNAVATLFSEEAYDEAQRYAGAFKDGTGKPMPLNWDAIMVKKGSANARAAIRQFASTISPVAIGDINLYEGSVTIIETPYLTTAGHWFLIDSSIIQEGLECPAYLGITKYPSMDMPMTLKNQAVRTNIEGFYKRGITHLPIGVYGGTA